MAHGLDFALQDHPSGIIVESFHMSATNWVINVSYVIVMELYS